jgi:hypothetical protein
MTGKWPAHEIDHRNGIGWDDRFENLREATHSQNLLNQRSFRKNNSSRPGRLFFVLTPCATVPVAWRYSLQSGAPHYGCPGEVNTGVKSFLQIIKHPVVIENLTVFLLWVLHTVMS